MTKHQKNILSLQNYCKRVVCEKKSCVLYDDCPKKGIPALSISEAEKLMKKFG